MPNQTNDEFERERQTAIAYGNLISSVLGLNVSGLKPLDLLLIAGLIFRDPVFFQKHSKITEAWWEPWVAKYGPAAKITSEIVQRETAADLGMQTARSLTREEKAGLLQRVSKKARLNIS
jgi:hypothetical protein